MIKHIFCDLDGTLYENGTITKEDMVAIEEIEKKEYSLMLLQVEFLNKLVILSKRV